MQKIISNKKSPSSLQIMGFLNSTKNYFFSVVFVSLVSAVLLLQQDLSPFLQSFLHSFLFLSSPFLSSPKVEADIEVAPTKEANATVKNIFFIFSFF